MSAPAEFSVRQRLMGDAADTLARLRTARRFDVVADILECEARLDWLLDQLGAPSGFVIVGPVPSPGWRLLFGIGTLAATAVGGSDD